MQKECLDCGGKLKLYRKFGEWKYYTCKKCNRIWGFHPNGTYKSKCMKDKKIEVDCLGDIGCH